MVDDYPSEIGFLNTPGYYWVNTAMLSDATGKLILTGKFAGDLGLDMDVFATREVVTSEGGVMHFN